MYIYDNAENIHDNAVYILDNVEYVHDNVENRLHLHRSRNGSQWFATEPAKIKEFRCGTVPYISFTKKKLLLLQIINARYRLR